MGFAVGTRVQAEPERAHPGAERQVAPGRTREITDALVSGSLAPDHPFASQRIGQTAVKARAAGAVVGDGGGADEKPIADEREMDRGTLVGRGRAVPRVEAVERHGQEEETLTLGGIIGCRSGPQRLTQGERVVMLLERGAGQEEAAASLVETVEPALARKDSRHLEPSTPPARRRGSEIECGGRATAAVPNDGGNEATRLPRPPPAQRDARLGEDRVVGDGGLSRQGHGIGGNRLKRALCKYQCGPEMGDEH